MSRLFQQVMHELGVRQHKSSAYHFESKMKRYCDQYDADWDEGIHLVLFAA